MQGPIVCDVAGTRLTESDVRRIAHPMVGMVILFTRNFENTAQLRELTDSIHSVKPDLLVSVDHEGGRVQRFRKGFTEIPAMRLYGEAYRTKPQEALRSIEAAGFVLASELNACGVDFTFAPVLDLDWARSGIIGERSLGKTPEAVHALATALLRGFSRAGFANCGKHYPGHGYAIADSHVALPEDDREGTEILQKDLLAYRLLGNQLTSLMTAHVLYPALDAVPATFSAKLLTELLRGELGFEGLVFSDDLSMKGAHAAGGILERAQKALLAGCDSLIVCNAPDTVDELLLGLTWKRTQTFERRAARLARSRIIESTDALKSLDEYQQALVLMHEVL